MASVTIIRQQLGLALVTSHVVVFILLLGLTALDRFTFPELINAAALITPMFAAFATVIVRWFFGTRTPDDATDVSSATVYLTWMIAGAYVALTFVAILWKSFLNLSFDDFVKLIGLIETTFAVYVGIVVHRYFGPAVAAS